MGDVRYLTGEVSAYSTGIPGRAIWSARTNHEVTDDLPEHGGPGEAPTAIELFLSGVAACAVFMVQRLAREAGVELKNVTVKMDAMSDRQAVRQGPAILDRVNMDFEFTGIDEAQAQNLVDTFKRR